MLLPDCDHTLWLGVASAEPLLWGSRPLGQFGGFLLCCELSLTCCHHMVQVCVSEGVTSGCSGAEVTSPLGFVLSCSKTVAGKLLEMPESLVCSPVVLFSLGYRGEEIDFLPFLRLILCFSFNLLASSFFLLTSALDTQSPWSPVCICSLATGHPVLRLLGPGRGSLVFLCRG